MNKLFLFFILFSSRIFWSAPCCSGNSQFPTIISSDDKFQISSSLSISSILAEAPLAGGISYRKNTDSETAQTFKLDAASLVSDRFQLGLSFPVIRRHRERKERHYSASGLGDISASLSYEFMPEWNYSLWIPRGFLFMSVTAPTGGSIWDAQQMFKLDSRGKGFWNVTLGSLLLKTVGNWDFSFLLEGHRGFSRALKSDLGELVLSPGFGFFTQLGLGFSPSGGNLRLGTALSRAVERATATSGVFDGEGSSQELWTPSFQLSYLACEDLAMNLSVSDQTLLASSKNSALAQTVSFAIQKRWAR